MVLETQAFEPTAPDHHPKIEAQRLFLLWTCPYLVIPTMIKAGFPLLLQNIHPSSLGHLSISYVLNTAHRVKGNHHTLCILKWMQRLITGDV